MMRWRIRVQQHACVGPRAALWSWFSLSTSVWVPGISPPSSTHSHTNKYQKKIRKTTSWQYRMRAEFQRMHLEKHQHFCTDWSRALLLPTGLLVTQDPPTLPVQPVCIGITELACTITNICREHRMTGQSNLCWVSSLRTSCSPAFTLSSGLPVTFLLNKHLCHSKPADPVTAPFYTFWLQHSVQRCWNRPGHPLPSSLKINSANGIWADTCYIL